MIDIKVFGDVDVDQDGNVTKKEISPNGKYLYMIEIAGYTYIGQSSSKLPKSRITEHILNAYGAPHLGLSYNKAKSEEAGLPIYNREGSKANQDNKKLIDLLSNNGAYKAKYYICDIGRFTKDAKGNKRELKDGFKEAKQYGNVRHLDYLEMMAIRCGYDQYHDFLLNKDLTGGSKKQGQTFGQPRIAFLKKKFGQSNNKLAQAVNGANFNLKLDIKSSGYNFYNPIAFFFKENLSTICKSLVGTGKEIQDLGNLKEIQKIILMIEQITKIKIKDRNKAIKELKQVVQKMSYQDFKNIVENNIYINLNSGLKTHTRLTECEQALSIATITDITFNGNVSSMRKGQDNTIIVKIDNIKLTYPIYNTEPIGVQEVKEYFKNSASEQILNFEDKTQEVKAFYIGELFKMYDDKVEKIAGNNTKMNTMHSLFKKGIFVNNQDQGTKFYDGFMDLMNRTKYGPLQVLDVNRLNKDFAFSRQKTTPNEAFNYGSGGYITEEEGDTMCKNAITNLNQLTIG